MRVNTKELKLNSEEYFVYMVVYLGFGECNFSRTRPYRPRSIPQLRPGLRQLGRALVAAVPIWSISPAWRNVKRH